ncbi:MAG: ferrous iron transport protein A [Phenylobacterium sp.]
MPEIAPETDDRATFRLGEARPGDRGVIRKVCTPKRRYSHALDPEELELRLLEFGFVEGAQVEVLHQGLFGGDPIAVKVDDMRIALRRSEAMNVIVAPVVA